MQKCCGSLVGTSGKVWNQEALDAITERKHEFLLLQKWPFQHSGAVIYVLGNVSSSTCYWFRSSVAARSAISVKPAVEASRCNAASSARPDLPDRGSI